MLTGAKKATVQSPYEKLSDDQKLGLNIKLRREELNLTQAQLGKLMNQTRYWVSDRECGYTEISWSELKAFAIALKCRSEELQP